MDANVLVDAQVRDLFLRMADIGLVDVRWSAEILAETRRALEDDLGIRPDRVDQLINTMQAAFPESEVQDYRGLIDSLTLPDADDRHVLAAALVSECDLVVTQNLRDFPDHLLDVYDLIALSVDDALSELIEVHGSNVLPAIDAQLAALTRPHIDVNEFLRRLSRIAPYASSAIGSLVGDENFSR